MIRSPVTGGSTSAERLLGALPLPTLRRLTKTYGLPLAPRANVGSVVSALARVEALDPIEVVRQVLRHEELVTVARRLGVSGTGTRQELSSRVARHLRWRRFSEAQEFVRGLGLRSEAEWRAWCRGERDELPPRPADVPTCPHREYGPAWRGMGDWLGTGTLACKDRTFRSFTSARDFVRALGLQTRDEFWAWRNGERPDLPRPPADVPVAVQVKYRGRGWAGWGDFLGTGRVAVFERVFWPFERARAFVRGLKIRSLKEWQAWHSAGLPGMPPRPPEVPTNPNRTYRDQWAGWNDWLGYRRWRPFVEARAFARRLGLRTHGEWLEFVAGRCPDLPEKPGDVPASPATVYRDAGWAGMADWLGSRSEDGRR